MYIYLGTMYHKRYKGTISVIDHNGEYIEVEKKIGKTIDLANRELQLNSTKFPVGYIIIDAWETGQDTDRVELAIHALLSHDRVEGEWFTDTGTLQTRLQGFMTKMGYNQVNFNNESDNETNTIVERITQRKTKNSWTNWPNLINKTFEIKRLGTVFSVTCLSETEWRENNSGKIYSTCNQAFSNGFSDAGVPTSQNVWSSKESDTGLTLREVHDYPVDF